ncbi:hypothetical protein RB620_20040 [Paenibacillus sp. LHD-117]|uniref:hypothetical protein n=1 Tax=Paenibacillus sp. LHD-117 TaxID=3071412 RepID=UPI0027E1DB03|nr:hypothetical protein [Paenibacillus sp. LHD-117]MDQ6421721.1 hypothetical protein [Paenibacillus sp. LHD-117]
MGTRIDPEPKVLPVVETALNETRINGMELFEIDVDPAFDAGAGTFVRCRYGLLRIVCGDHAGWGSCTLSAAGHRFDIVRWASYLHRLKPMTVGEAIEYAERERGCWGACKSDLVLEALSDLKSNAGNNRFGNSEEPASIMKHATAYYSVLY